MCKHRDSLHTFVSGSSSGVSSAFRLRPLPVVFFSGAAAGCDLGRPLVLPGLVFLGGGGDDLRPRVGTSDMSTLGWVASLALRRPTGAADRSVDWDLRGMVTTELYFPI